MTNPTLLRTLGLWWTLGLLVAGCGALPLDGGTGAPARAWQVVHQGDALGGTLLSVWGWDDRHLLAVGGPVGNGTESLVYLYDGQTTRQLHPGGTETFWWVHGTGPTDVWMVGEQGRITHYDGDSFRTEPLVVDTTLWGVQAFAPDDVWAVGGAAGRADPSLPHDVVLHFDGDQWARVPLPGEPRNVALLKLWGASADDLFVVGEQGTIWHRTRAGWVLESAEHNPPLTRSALFSAHGCGADDVWAVGGNALLRRRGGVWAAVPALETGVGNVVTCDHHGEVLVVGMGGMKLRVSTSTQKVWDDSFVEPWLDLHGAWTSPDGTVWVTGGDWLSRPMPGAPREGVLARLGVGRVNPTLLR